MSGYLLEMGKKAKKGKGYALAKQILESGKAYDKFIEIVKAQKGKEINPSNLKLAKFRYDIKSTKSGKIKHLDNKALSRIARRAGSPHDKAAGVYLIVKKNFRVKKGDVLFTIYAENKDKLRFAINTYKDLGGFYFYQYFVTNQWLIKRKIYKV